MAVASKPVAASSPKLLTVADLEALPETLPSGPAKYELIRGELLIMTPPGDEHGGVQANVTTELKIQGERKGHGKARVEVGIVLARDPDTLVGADAAFIANASLPLRRTSEGYLETIPELVVEVRSKNDTRPAVRKKVGAYLKAGVRVVWVLDPAARTVAAYRKGSPPETFAETDTLTVEDIIPGFRFPVADLFRE